MVDLTDIKAALGQIDRLGSHVQIFLRAEAALFHALRFYHLCLKGPPAGGLRAAVIKVQPLGGLPATVG